MGRGSGQVRVIRSVWREMGKMTVLRLVWDAWKREIWPRARWSGLGKGVDSTAAQGSELVVDLIALLAGF